MTLDASRIVLEYTKIKENAIIANTNSVAKQDKPSARKEGTLQLVSPNGEVLGAYKFVNGGGGRGFIPGGSYTVTGRENLAPSDVRPMTIGGVGYKYRVLTSSGNPQIPDPRYPNQPRSGILIHPDGGAPGTNGCIGIIGGPEVQKDFMQKMDSLIQQGGGRYTFKFDSGAAAPMGMMPGSTSTNQPTANQPEQLDMPPTPMQQQPPGINAAPGSFGSFVNMLNTFQPGTIPGQQFRSMESPFGRMATAATKPSSRSQFAQGRLSNRAKPSWVSK